MRTDQDHVYMVLATAEKLLITDRTYLAKAFMLRGFIGIIFKYTGIEGGIFYKFTTKQF